jgi:hypothetical protein
MPLKQFYIFVLISSIYAFCNAQTKTIAFSNPNIYYEGRIVFRKDAAELSWPGTSICISFVGTGVSAILKDSDTANYYNIIVDEKDIFVIHTDTLKRSYVLTSGLPERKHKVQLFKRTESDKGKTWFYGFESSYIKKILPLRDNKKRKIEFYGNSITCGYAIEDFSGKDSWYGYFENNYLTYAALTARYFDAKYFCISKSGIGVMISWFPIIMPEMYDRLDPTDSTSRWDFTKYSPDIVVIDLFQNDSWLIKMPEHEQFKTRFGTTAPDENYIISSYKNFVMSIRKRYPDASIICSLGNMDATIDGSLWPEYIRKAVGKLQDQKIYIHFFKYKNSNGHPKVYEQKTMAESLIDFIESNIKW